MSEPFERRVVLGFLTVRRSTTGGLRGGYLLTTEFGRPLEFHYTSELRIVGPQRALFGGAAPDCLHVESFGQPLLARQTVAPQLLLTNLPTLLDVRRRIPAPVLLVRPGEIAAHRDYPADRAAFDRARAIMPPNFSWTEPFDRLDEALEEIRDARPAAA